MQIYLYSISDLHLFYCYRCMCSGWQNCWILHSLIVIGYFLGVSFLWCSRVSWNLLSINPIFILSRLIIMLLMWSLIMGAIRNHRFGYLRILILVYLNIFYQVSIAIQGLKLANRGHLYFMLSLCIRLLF